MIRPPAAGARVVHVRMLEWLAGCRSASAAGQPMPPSPLSLAKRAVRRPVSLPDGDGIDQTWWAEGTP